MASNTLSKGLQKAAFIEHFPTCPVRKLHPSLILNIQ